MLEHHGATDIVADHKVEDGINGARQILSICEFDEGPCADGLKALRAYRKEWDEEHGCWKDKPRHDWASHGADAFRYLAIAYRDIQPVPPPKPKPVFAWQVQPDGSIRSGLTFRELVARQRKPRA